MTNSSTEMFAGLGEQLALKNEACLGGSHRRLVTAHYRELQRISPQNQDEDNIQQFCIEQPSLK